MRPACKRILAALIAVLPAIIAATARATGNDAGQLAPPPFASGTETVSLAAALMKAFGALILVIGLMLLLTKLFRRLGTGCGGMNQGLINILETRMIAPKKQVAVIEVGGECVVVGITDQQISLITRLENPGRLLKPAGKPATSANGRAIQGSNFSALLDKALRPAGKTKTEERHD